MTTNDDDGKLRPTSASMSPQEQKEFPKLFGEMLLFDDAMEDFLGALPLWDEQKKFAQIFSAAGHPALSHCGCRSYRRAHTTICVCEHDFDWHEEGLTCWAEPA